MTHQIIKLIDVEKRQKVDGELFNKYELVVQDLEISKNYNFGFWYSHTSKSFCEDSFYEETDKNRVTREFVTTIYPNGLITKDSDEFFGSLVSEEYKNLVLTHFDYNELVNNKVDKLEELIKKDFSENEQKDWFDYIKTLKECNIPILLYKYEKVKGQYKAYGKTIFNSWNNHLIECMNHMDCCCKSSLQKELGGARGVMSVEYW